MAKSFPSVKAFVFRAGPYPTPEVEIGGELEDEARGQVRVEAFTKAPIRWPAFKCPCGPRGIDLMPVLFDGLVRAVCEEEEAVVAHYWGVTNHAVDRWKKALAGGATNPHEVFVNLAIKRSSPAFRKKFGYP